jgi:nucleoside-diphosphate-sugar epimerase
MSRIAMSHIAILGATSQIARDFTAQASDHHTLSLYARRPEAVKGALPFGEFGKAPYDAVINFVGAGDPARVKEMGITILEITQEFDNLALNFIKNNPACRYFFLSSGVASGRDFLSETSTAQKDLTDVSALAPQDYYSAAKFQAEARHRALAALPIVDLRLFNYFSHTGDWSARFFMTDVVRTIRDKTVFKTSADNMVRDYLHPEDFYQLVDLLLAAPPDNCAVECYSRAPVDKLTLLKEMESRFGLCYEITEVKPAIVNATGAKPYYYSTNRDAAALGYKPKYSSVAGLLQEAAKLLDG